VKEDGPMLHVRGLHKSHRTGAGATVPVLRGIDLDIGHGELVAILGSSGSGKSTLLSVLGLLDNYDRGLYRLLDQPMHGLSEARAAETRNRHIGFVFQSFNLLPFKTALENVAMPLFYQGVSARARDRTAAKFLERVGLLDRATHLPSELSGGQQQRVAIARALVTRPRIILADEPTGALDTSTAEHVLELLQDINRHGVTVVLVTHDPDVAARCGRRIRVRDGVVVDGG
jgi:putative ABC transport system ATP-binding protein